MKPNKKMIITALPYVLTGCLGNKLTQAYRLTPGEALSDKFIRLDEGMGEAFSSLLPGFHWTELLGGLTAALILAAILYTKRANAKKYRRGMEYGSARWGNSGDIQPYIDPNFYRNVLLTQTERLTLNSRPADPTTARNKNVLVIGGSGSGKTRFYVKPNLMQLHSSYVVTDPKGYNNIGQRKSHTVRRKSPAMWLFLYPI